RDGQRRRLVGDLGVDDGRVARGDLHYRGMPGVGDVDAIPTDSQRIRHAVDRDGGDPAAGEVDDGHHAGERRLVALTGPDHLFSVVADRDRTAAHGDGVDDGAGAGIDGRRGAGMGAGVGAFVVGDVDPPVIPRHGDRGRVVADRYGPEHAALRGD